VTLIATSMAGYVFDRKDFKYKELLYSVFIAFMFVNVGSVTLRPLFELAVKVKMNTSLLSVVLISAGTGQATYIFLCRGFVRSIPKEIDEAAKIDGFSFFGIYRMILLPLLKLVLATIGLLSFRGGWNEYILPLVFTMSNDALRPLTVGVVMLRNSGDGTAAWNIMFAGATISIVPIIVVYLFTSKRFMSGLVAGAVKG
jgi:ABC-type glycerol-3-phosphate transport system permease component